MTSDTDWRTPWRSFRWVFSAIWMLFLVYPIISVVTADLSTPLTVVGLAMITAFAAIYLLSAVYLLNDPGAPNRFGPWVFAALLILACGLLPLIGEGAFGVAPFLMVVAAFTFPFGWATASVAGLVVAAVIAPLWAGWEVDFTVIVIMIGVGFTMLGLRAVSVRERERESAEEQQRTLDEQLAVVAERERVARDVHDILGHSLTVITVKSELAGRLVDLDPDRAKHELAELNSLAREALAEVRATVGQLRAPDLPSTIASARSALEAADIDAHLPDPHTVPADAATATLFAWVLREAITNVVRHSGASTCKVTIDNDTLTVHDDGHGMDPSRWGNGLTGLAERLDDAGGVLTIRSDDTGHGTTLLAECRR